MPLFYFDFIEPEGVTVDDEGTAYADLAQAQYEAARTLIELAKDTPPPFAAAIHIRHEPGAATLCRVSLDLMATTAA